jgi:hypothetical protein
MTERERDCHNIYIYIYKEKGGVSHYDTTLEFEF